MRVTKLFFCQIDPPLSASFWQKNRLDTQILFDLCVFEHFSPVANFAQQSILFTVVSINGGLWLVIISKLVVGQKNDCYVMKKTPIYFSVTTLLIPQKVSNKVTQWARFSSVLPSCTLSRK